MRVRVCVCVCVCTCTLLLPGDDDGGPGGLLVPLQRHVHAEQVLGVLGTGNEVIGQPLPVSLASTYIDVHFLISYIHS